MLTNLRLMPAELQQFIGALSQNRAMADEFTDNFNYPERQWDCFASVERMRAWCAARMPAPPSQPLPTPAQSSRQRVAALA